MKNVIIKILQFIGAIVYSVVIGYLLWRLFQWATPYLLKIDGPLKLVIFCVVCVVVSITFFQLASGLLYDLVQKLSRNNLAAKIVMVPAFLYFGYKSVTFPFHSVAHFGVIQWLVVIMLALIILYLFIALIKIPFSSIKED